MTAPNTNKTFSASGKPETAKQWLQRRLRKLPSFQPSNDIGDGGLRDTASLQRPGLAPLSSITIESDAKTMTSIPPIPINIQRSMHSSSIQPPLRPSRPNSGVARDISAWLNASSTPSPPLMGGVSYWRMATVNNVENTVSIQHATPIVQDSEYDRPSTSPSQQATSFRRRAKKIQVQMPLLCNKSLRHTGWKQVNGRSNSTPVLSVPYEATEEGTPPMIMTRRRSVRKSTLRIIPSMSSTLPPTRLPSEDPLLAQPSFRYGNSSSTRTSKAEGSIERRMNALLVRSTRSADSTRPSTAAAHMHREYSMGDLSDAPSYFTGPPPPSYRSRPASILTTSSFGCIDGMSPAQRQISRQRAALQRGVKGRLKRLAQNFTSSTSRSTDS